MEQKHGGTLLSEAGFTHLYLISSSPYPAFCVCPASQVFTPSKLRPFPGRSFPHSKSHCQNVFISKRIWFRSWQIFYLLILHCECCLCGNILQGCSFGGFFHLFFRFQNNSWCVDIIPSKKKKESVKKKNSPLINWLISAHWKFDLIFQITKRSRPFPRCCFALISCPHL